MWRKKMNRKLIVVLFLLFLHPLLTAQQTYSLQDLVARGLEHNYQLQIVRNQEQMAQNMNTAGNAGMLPSVTLGGQHTRQLQDTETNLFTGETRSGSNALNTSLNAFAEVNWTVFDGFSMFARRDRLNYLARLGELDTRYYVEQTVADIAHAYHQLMKEKSLLALQQQSLEISAFRLDLEAKKRQVGAGNALLYHQALIDFNTDSSMVSARASLIRDLQMQINRIVNFAPEQDISPEISEPELFGVEDRSELLDKALAANPDMERARLEEMIADAESRAQRGGRYPQLALFGGYGYNKQTSELGLMQSSRNFGPNVGVSLRFNLYDGGRQNTRIKNTLLEQDNAAVAMQDTRAWLESELARLLNTYDNYLERYTLLEQSRQSADASLAIAQQQLETGSISGFEFRQTQLAALNVENQMTELRFAMKSIEIEMDRITGRLLQRIL